jgi:DeoR/GlpR family transcriptional regulator of sugar metabolism
MFGAERRQLILELVRAHGSVSMRDLAKAVNVSEVTVRRDVSALEWRGLLDRRHGGAMLPGREDGREDSESESLVLGDAATLPRTVMFGAERRRLICELVRANKAVSLGDLARAVNVSETTVRRDLDTLEKRGVIQRTHGGAVLAQRAEGLRYEPDTEAVQPPRVPEKAAIAALAATMVGDGEAIMVGAGTTAYEFAQRLAPTSPLTVLTNSMLVARALARTPHVELVLTSGSLDNSSLALVGSTAERWMAGHRVSRAFVSGTGLTADRGLSSSHLALSAVDRAMVGSAHEVIVLADHSKLGVETTYQVAPITRIDHLVTDDAPDTSVIESLQARGVRVHIAPPRRPVMAG